MPHIFNHEDMPTTKKRTMEWLFMIFLVINVVDPVVYYSVLFYGNWCSTKYDENPLETEQFWAWTYGFTHYMVGTLQVVSGIFLLVAVYLIRDFMVNQGMRNQVNYQSMTLHAFSFTLYNISVVAFYVSYFVYLKHLNNLAQQF